ncbi:unnamed protein product [Brassica oleracea var. botrytis]
MYNYNVEFTSKKEVYLRNGRSWKLIRYIKTHIAILPIIPFVYTYTYTCVISVYTESIILVSVREKEIKESHHFPNAVFLCSAFSPICIFSESHVGWIFAYSEDELRRNKMDFGFELGSGCGENCIKNIFIGFDSVHNLCIKIENLGMDKIFFFLLVGHIYGGSVSSNNRGKKKRPSSVGFKRESDNALRMEGNEDTALGKEEGTMDDASYSHHVIHHYFYI